MKSLTVPLAAWLLASGTALAQDPQALLQKHSCTICHAQSEAGAGPAFADIAEKYKGHANAAAVLRGEIRQGIRGGGPWHMPPHPEITEREADAMARYILAVKA